MEILAVGIGHRHSALSVREKFAIAKEKAKQLLKAYTALPEVGGCAIVSTCNRTEIYASVTGCHEIRLDKILCDELNQDYEEYKAHFTSVSGEDAIKRLCAVAAGLDSQIFGDDQIITQVRESVELSRSAGCADSYIETAFNVAVQTAKSIKTNIILCSPKSNSAASRAVEALKAACALTGKNALVIGNGRIGKLVTALLINEGANVTVTLREYRKGVIEVPNGAATIPYSRRYEAVDKSHIVVSATTSPHYTLHYDDFLNLANLPEFVVDLAAPRDVEPEISQLSGITYLSLDDLADSGNKLQQDELDRVDGLIAEGVENYLRWKAFKEAIK